MGEFEAIGDAVTGSMLGRAVEPGAGEPGADGHTHERACLNCGAMLAGDFCHNCGQKAHVHRTLTGFFHDLLHGVLHFEGKIWNTLPMLAWRPGELTRRYIGGQRARFVSPIALFLFSVFLMFAAVSLFAGGGDFPEQAKKGLQEELRVDQAKLSKLKTLRDAEAKAGRPTAALDEKIGDVKDEIAAITAAREGDLSKARITSDANIPGWIGSGVAKAAKNPELVAFKLKTNAYKFSWLIIPLSVPFVWLLFPFRRRFRLYDHTIFVTYSLCFMMLLVIAGVILQGIGAASIAGLLWLIPPFHMYRQLKGAYGLSGWGAGWRAAVLTMFALLVISLFAALLVGVGMFE